MRARAYQIGASADERELGAAFCRPGGRTGGNRYLVLGLSIKPTAKQRANELDVNHFVERRDFDALPLYFNAIIALWRQDRVVFSICRRLEWWPVPGAKLPHLQAAQSVLFAYVG